MNLYYFIHQAAMRIADASKWRAKFLAKSSIEIGVVFSGVRGRPTAKSPLFNASHNSINGDRFHARKLSVTPLGYRQWIALKVKSLELV
jgi:hypothetical protein